MRVGWVERSETHRPLPQGGDSLLQPPQLRVREHPQTDRRRKPGADGAKSGMSCPDGETLRDSPVFSGQRGGPLEAGSASEQRPFAYLL
jgi:hypothetical protein